MKLYCVRHCEALSAQEDPERALSPRGCTDVNKMAQHLLAQKISVAHILHSSKCRARQTANVFAQALHGSDVTECDALLSEYMDVMPMVDMIDTWEQDTMLVGHMPFMPRLISRLIAGDENQSAVDHFPVGTVACLEKIADDGWRLCWVRSPADVPDAP